MKVTKKRIKRINQQAVDQASQEEQHKRKSNMEEGKVGRTAKAVVGLASPSAKTRSRSKARMVVLSRRHLVGGVGSDTPTGRHGARKETERRHSPFGQGWKAAGREITRITGEPPRTSDTPPPRKDESSNRVKKAEAKAKAKVIKRTQGTNITPTQLGKRIGKATWWAGKQSIRRDEGSRGIQRLLRKAKAGKVNPTSVGAKAKDMANRSLDFTPPSEREKNVRGLEAASTSVETDVKRKPAGYDKLSPIKRRVVSDKRAHQAMKSAQRAHSRGIGTFQGADTDNRSDEPDQVAALAHLSKSDPDMKRNIQRRAHNYRIRRAQRHARRNPGMN